LVDGTAPTQLKEGVKAIVDARAGKIAQERFNRLLGSVNKPVYHSSSSLFNPSAIGQHRMPAPISAAA